MNTKFSDFLKQQVQELKDKNIYWNIRTLQGPSTPRAKVAGKKVIMLGANNYLSLSNHPKLKSAAIAAVKKYGAGSGSVRAIAGTMDLHTKLEETIAKFKHAEAAVYYQTGFAANAGLIPAMSQEGDLLISDELNHGSIIDGVRLSKAERAIFKHKDTDDLKRVLEEAQQKNYNKIFVISDGVFSMDGDIAPADKIVKICDEHNAISYIDDAHGDGVLGKQGRGISSHFDIEGKLDIEMGTFSKAFGVVGGYICGSKELCEFAFNKSRTWLLSGSAPPAVAAACMASLQLLEKDKKIIPQLWKNREYFMKGLKQLGFDTGQSETPIIPVMLGESSIAQNFSKELFNEGVFALPIVFPMVARDKARIRTQICSALSKKDLDEALAAFESVGRRLKVI